MPIKYKPIRFSGEMIRALLAGEKTQTRRIIRADYDDIGERDDGTLWPWREDLEQGGDYWYPCPYGETGDLLWVQETFKLFDASGASGTPIYRASNQDDEGIWTPSIHMLRWASRLTLEITDVRVERLQDISEEDARAEGAELDTEPCDHSRISCADIGCLGQTHKSGFYCIWESIYPGDWERNPYVWVLTFKVHQQNIDALIKQRDREAQ